ncbi:MAG: cobalamin-dependent protein [Bdellovibrionota bacterium]
MAENGAAHLQAARGLYQRALESGSRVDAEQAVDMAIGSGALPLEIYEQVIIPGQTALGDQWQRGSLSISEEHAATQVSIEQLSRLRGLIRPKPALHKRVLVSTMSGDAHWLGARVVADYFLQDGWTVDFLGACPPLEDLLLYLKKTAPDVILFSLTMKSELDQLSQLSVQLNSWSAAPKMIVGGQMFLSTETSSPTIEGAHIAQDARSAVRLARNLAGVSGASGDLEQLLSVIGERLQSRRKALGLSQKELASAVGLDRAYVSSVEGGKQNVTVGALLRLATALELSIEELVRTD